MAARGVPLPPCRLRPDQWSESHTDAEAKRLCRQCWRRYDCAVDALRDTNTIWRLRGVIAGVGIPPQNKHGTSKSRRQALTQLHAIAAVGKSRVAQTPPAHHGTPAAAPKPAPTAQRRCPAAAHQRASAHPTPALAAS